MREPVSIYRPPVARNAAFALDFSTGADVREIDQTERETFEFTEVQQVKVFSLLPTPATEAIGIGWRIRYAERTYVIDRIVRQEYNSYWQFYGARLT